jgi:hypothetical protein
MTYADRRVSDSTQEMVLELLRTEADMDGLVIVGYPYVGDKLGVHANTVGAAVDYLISRGFIEHRGHSGRGNLNVLQLTDF